MHYTCIVVGDDWEKQLEPFDENAEIEPYKAYWDTRELESWERILMETSTERHPDPKDRTKVETYVYPDDQVLREGWTIEDMARTYNARYGYTVEGEEEDRGTYAFIDSGGIYQWSTYPPQSKWDWYEMGGRWMGYFRLKTNGKGKLGEPGLGKDAPTNDVDQARKGDIDIEGMRDAAGEGAGELWDEVNPVLEGLPVAESWEAFVEKIKVAEAEGEEYGIDQAREEYHAQPAVVAFTEWTKTREAGYWFMGPGVESFQMPRDEYVQRARDNALTPYAFLKDGEWHAPGKMGWFASSDQEADRRRFQSEFNEMLDSITDDTVLTLVDLHI